MRAILRTILRTAALGLFLLPMSGTPDAEAQVRRFRIEHADSTTSRVIGGRRVTELFNVTISEDTARLRALRAIDYGDGEFHFYRNVSIIDEGDTLTANEVRYSRRTKVGRAIGNVRLGDGEVVVTAPEGDFDLDADRADFRDGVRMVDSVSVLTSDGGSYWTEEKRAEFAGDVRLDSDDTDVLSDSLTYHRVGQRSDARGNVVISRHDGGIRTLILAARAVNDDSLETGFAQGNVLVARMDSTEADTLYIQAERVWSERVEETDRTAAAGSVSIWNDGFSALADSVYQLRRDSPDRAESRLFGSPFIWVDQSQVSGDSVRVSGKGNGVDTLQVFGNAFVAQRDSVLDRLQQLKGRSLTGLFESDSLRSLDVTPNAEAVYWRRDENDALHGAYHATGDRITFRFEGDELSGFAAYDELAGTYYPVAALPQELSLDGLRWRPGDRPTAERFRARLLEALDRLRQPPDQ